MSAVPKPSPIQNGLREVFGFVLPEMETGYYCLFLAEQKRHVWASSREELAQETEARTDRQGVYFALVRISAIVDAQISLIVDAVSA